VTFFLILARMHEHLLSRKAEALGNPGLAHTDAGILPGDFRTAKLTRAGPLVKRKIILFGKQNGIQNPKI